MSTMLPAARLRITICTSCWVDEESDTLGAFRLERHLSIGADGEPAQSGQRCRLALTESAEELVYHRIQTVRGLGLSYAGFTSHPPGNIGLLHSDSTLTGRRSETRLFATCPFR